MKIALAATCDYATVDQHGKLSVIGIFQHVWVGKFPAVHPRLHLVLRLEGKRTEVGSHEIDIQFVDDHDNALIKGGGNVNFAEPRAGVTNIDANAILVFDVPLPHEGKYAFRIKIDQDVEAVLPLTAASALSAPPTTQQPTNPNLN